MRAFPKAVSILGMEWDGDLPELGSLFSWPLCHSSFPSEVTFNHKCPISMWWSQTWGHAQPSGQKDVQFWKLLTDLLCLNIYNKTLVPTEQLRTESHLMENCNHHTRRNLSMVTSTSLWHGNKMRLLPSLSHLPWNTHFIPKLQTDRQTARQNEELLSRWAGILTRKKETLALTWRLNCPYDASVFHYKCHKHLYRHYSGLISHCCQVNWMQFENYTVIL